QIGFFKIIAESAVASGVRRIEAITGRKSAQVIREQFELVNQMKESLKNPKDFVSTLTKVIDDNSALKKEIDQFIVQKSLALKANLDDKLKKVGNINFLSAIVDLPTQDAVKTLAFAFKGSFEELFLVFGAVIDGKPSLTVLISD